METLQCLRCGETKPIAKFQRRKLDDGRFVPKRPCLACRAIVVRERYRKRRLGIVIVTPPRAPAREWTHKRCPRCGETKAVAGFYWKSAGYWESECKVCHKEHLRRQRRAHGIRERKGIGSLPRHDVYRTAKTCRRCGEFKELAAFPRLTHGANGRGSWCKPCLADYNRVHHSRKLRRHREDHVHA